MVEQPDLHSSSRWDRYLDGMTTIADEYVAVGSAGTIVSSDVDPLLLAAIGYEESRHRPAIEDGDCVHPNSGVVCRSVGPMQLSRALVVLMPRIDAAYPSLTIDALRAPHESVAASYRLLRYYRETCHGGPAQWLGAWSSGRCTRRPIRLGVRRCHLAAAMAVAAGIEHLDCGPRAPDLWTAVRVSAILSTHE